MPELTVDAFNEANLQVWGMRATQHALRPYELLDAVWPELLSLLDSAPGSEAEGQQE